MRQISVDSTDFWALSVWWNALFSPKPSEIQQSAETQRCLVSCHDLNPSSRLKIITCPLIHHIRHRLSNSGGINSLYAESISNVAIDRSGCIGYFGLAMLMFRKNMEFLRKKGWNYWDVNLWKSEGNSTNLPL